MKHIALLISQAGKKGGLQKYARKTAEAFAARGCRVSVLTLGQTSAPEANYACISVGKPSPLSVLNLWQYDRAVCRWLRENPAEIVFGFDRTRCQTHIRAGNGVHAAYLQQRSLCDSWARQLSFKLNPLHRSILHFERVAFESPTLQKLFTNSAMVRDEVLKFYNTDPAKIEVIHNGVEWTAWQQPFDAWPTAKEEHLRALGLPSDAFYFLFIGHGYRRKGLHLLLEGLSALKQRQAHLLVVGKDKEEGWFQAYAKKLGVDSQVHFFGQRSDVMSFYQASDALVIPSLYDPFANVTVEALAMGLHVVSSRSNGGYEVLTAVNGTIIDRLQDIDSVTEALRKALERPKSTISAPLVRQSVRHLDFSHQLDLLITKTL